MNNKINNVTIKKILFIKLTTFIYKIFLFIPITSKKELEIVNFYNKNIEYSKIIFIPNYHLKRS